MNINDQFQSKWLKAADIERMRLPVILTIDDVRREQVGGNDGRDKETKAVVYFRNREKGVLLNKENAERLIRICGSTETDEWIGVQVGLTIEQTKFKGQPVPGLRFVDASTRQTLPQPQRQPQRPERQRHTERDPYPRRERPVDRAEPDPAPRRAVRPVDDDFDNTPTPPEPADYDEREPGGDDDIPF